MGSSWMIVVNGVWVVVLIVGYNWGRKVGRRVGYREGWSHGREDAFTREVGRWKLPRASS